MTDEESRFLWDVGYHIQNNVNLFGILKYTI